MFTALGTVGRLGQEVGGLAFGTLSPTLSQHFVAFNRPRPLRRPRPRAVNYEPRTVNARPSAPNVNLVNRRVNFMLTLRLFKILNVYTGC